MELLKYNDISYKLKHKRVKASLTLLFVILYRLQAFSTNYTSTNSNFIRANWNYSSTWQSGTIPPSSGFAMNSNINIIYGTPFQSIVDPGDLTFDNNSNLTINASDTLIVKNFTVNSGSNLSIHGVLIVTGNLVNNGGIADGSGTGRIVVLGNISNTGGAINNITAYVFGSYTNIGSGSYLQKTQTNFNTDYAVSTNMYKSVQSSVSIITLPIELISFTAISTNTSIQLTWKTATEINNDYFNLERSSDGVNWTEIYSCPGAGTSTIPHNYSYLDETTIETFCYYRLKQTDVNGNFTYSNIISSKANNYKSITCKIYPIPSTGLINISADYNLHASITIEIVTAIGEKIYTSNTFQSVIDLSNIDNGLYYLKLYSANAIVVKPIIISK